MDYKKIYNQLVESRKLLNRSKKDSIYFESHHILPKCFGGLNNKENLVLLTFKEHYMAHRLLVEMNEGLRRSKMTFALLKMIGNNKDKGTSARQYEIAKRLVSENCRGENSPNFGLKRSPENVKKLAEFNRNRIVSDETRRKNSEAKKGIKLSDEHKKKLSIIASAQIRQPHTEESKRKISEGNKGKKASEKTRQKMRIANLGKKASEESKKKMSDWHKGKKVSEATKQKLSEINKGKIISEEHKKRLREANLGKKHSELSKEKMSEWHKGKKLSDEHKLSISLATKIWMTDEYKKKQGEKSRASWALRKEKQLAERIGI